MVVVRPEDQEVELHQDAVFECGVAGNPRPSVFWSLEGSRSLVFPGAHLGRLSASSTHEEGRVVLTLQVSHHAPLMATSFPFSCNSAYCSTTPAFFRHPAFCSNISTLSSSLPLLSSATLIPSPITLYSAALRLPSLPPRLRFPSPLLFSPVTLLLSTITVHSAALYIFSPATFAFFSSCNTSTFSYHPLFGRTMSTFSPTTSAFSPTTSVFSCNTSSFTHHPAVCSTST
ncbi:hypothetical protein PR048_016945 [Dryococelus australis]|uniref:Ig-like domain-containing protein n=1 Tax=Dryococelus australis TaxID=614101 RepID=A0ABQ9H857_9NEOP|nr:hypothetical protein PR048_016945 [Dryococelus australis]